MKDWEEIIHHQTFRFIDHTKQTAILNKRNTALTSFAIDDAIATSVSEEESPPTVRLWAHPNTIVLGIPDGRLPYIDKGVDFLRSHGYEVIIRNSGGLAVALDQHVLNLSLILPNMDKISIHDSYEAMFSFIKQLFHDVTSEIEAYEIVGSYCPGDYDLSINGRKFAGISQRRIKNAVATQIYLDVNGISKQHAVHIQEFYQLAKGEEETKFVYPDVVPDVMASFAELVEQSLTIEDVKMRVYETLEGLSDEIIQQDFSELEKETFEKRYAQMLKRNERIM